MTMAAIGAAVMASGCKSIAVDRRGHHVAMDGDGQVIRNAAGEPVILDLGWSVDYFQHWNWQRFEELHAKAGEAEFDLNGYEGGAAASNLVALVAVSLDGVATVAEKVVKAIVSQGASIAGSVGSAAIQAAAERFVAAGGDAAAAKIECRDGSCTITDGTVSEVCQDCIAK